MADVENIVVPIVVPVSIRAALLAGRDLDARDVPSCHSSTVSRRRRSPGLITASRTKVTPSAMVTSARMRQRLIAPAIGPVTGNGGGGSFAASASARCAM